MTRFLDDHAFLAYFCACLAAVALCAFVVVALQGCGGAAYVGAEADYAAANGACVLYADATAMSQICVTRVKETWCGDGGLQTTVEGGLCQ